MARIVIDQERCKGCQLCVQFCPPRVLTMSSRLNSRGFYTVELMDEGRCTSCAACALVCPDVVITVFKPERVRAA
ncbi:MAG: 4Fe-4S binding protein [Armatimonadota bacterium]|nr:4Fe-4S binding protein [Armatimonadota bacterium]MDR7426550.1 4Fe-4S binding protein [Armatimonadota bacterium]MDR7464245.1 4Fe-4S binding protein [Armatimonadota bacterium]MDR7470840.1 4Fe-4S binding protein [Armatimonadota bacterium]MDR7474528.1 4Fe-4S binding protein [Armatimonadota bacterium]